MTPARQRALNLCQKLRNTGLAVKRFWFTDFAAVSLEEPTKILERVFLTPKDFDEGTLYGFRD